MVLDSGPLHRQGGDVALDEGVEAGDVGRIGLDVSRLASAKTRLFKKSARPVRAYER